MNILTLENLNKNFGSLEILKGINFSINQGESVAIVGPSGTGKSTFLHISGLMEKPSSGRILINEQDTRHLSDDDSARLRLDHIGFLFQFHYLLPDFNVIENVMIPNRLAKDDMTSSRIKAMDLLERLGLKNRLTHRPSELSGGEQQRTALARALIRKPQLLLCDEPTGNLDHETAEDVMSLISKEMDSSAVATIIVTHNEKVAGKIQKRLYLENGTFENLEVHAH